MATLPECETLKLERSSSILHLTLNRPDSRNAMSLAMVHELRSVFAAIRDDTGVRAVVLRGTGGHFCAGGDVKDMASARGQKAEDGSDPIFELNRAFGHLLSETESAPQTTVAVLEGAVMGGGFGLACVSDVALCLESAKFGLPETTLGITPAQIAPFVVRRIGLTQARRLALTGHRFDGSEAFWLGVVHDFAKSGEELDQKLRQVLERIRHCAPGASQMTKELLLAVESEPLDELLDRAARDFAGAVRGHEGQEGTMAFMQKRKPSWAEE
ncbi:enoyl-CoA hydratase-related protein [uncultured Halovibrio sp.]|uniref:enoyl-CoA hydratase/isomerase family protein n=1 Tax=uncultured Halovibrio sp. TaxID=985049 RepID=UPI00260119ED|nr:enoyl-CoA hydratase-related protein [uncultured Halovibrio sp.]